MKAILFSLGLLALVSVSLGSELEEDHAILLNEMRKQEGTIGGNHTVSELASEIVSEFQKAGQDVMRFVSESVSEQNNRRGRALETDALTALLQQLSSARAGHNDEAAAQPTDAERADDESSYKPPSSYEDKNKDKIGGVFIPKPVLVPVPGPPGPPGPPGLPGLPGIPGKSPNLNGIKSILLARLARILLLIKAVAVLCFGLNAALLATTLGLALPLYKKFKKAGVVVPITEPQEPSYGPPAPAYGAPAPSYGAPAPAYGAPPPSYAEPAPAYGAPPPEYQRRSDSQAGSFAPVPESAVNAAQNAAFKGIRKSIKKFNN